MKRINRIQGKAVVVLVSCVLFVSTGCDDEVARELVAVSSTYVGDVASILAAEYLLDVMRIESEREDHAHDEVDEHDDEHSHDAEPLHDHDH